jgi:3'-phosphoadenosine 5'-phosphosulfate (PAPS) 3'-phosphatase
MLSHASGHGCEQSRGLGRLTYLDADSASDPVTPLAARVDYGWNFDRKESSSMAYEQERAVAIAAVTLAAQLCETVRREMVPEAMEKSDKSPVTVADYGSQAIICQALAAAFPNDPVVGEEDATDLKQPEMGDRLQQITGFVQPHVPAATPDLITQWIDHGNGSVGRRFWTLDPIDGTKGFLRGISTRSPWR